MKQSLNNRDQREWLRVLGKGMITIPKRWRQELGFYRGEVIRAQKVGDKVVLEARQTNAPYRIYTDREIDQWIKEDKLPREFEQKIDRKIASKRA